jgi:hypothetical protein
MDRGAWARWEKDDPRQCALQCASTHIWERTKAVPCRSCRSHEYRYSRYLRTRIRTRSDTSMCTSYSVPQVQWSMADVQNGRRHDTGRDNCGQTQETVGNANENEERGKRKEGTRVREKWNQPAATRDGRPARFFFFARVCLREGNKRFEKEVPAAKEGRMAQMGQAA